MIDDRIGNMGHMQGVIDSPRPSSSASDTIANRWPPRRTEASRLSSLSEGGSAALSAPAATGDAAPAGVSRVVAPGATVGFATGPPTAAPPNRPLRKGSAAALAPGATLM